MQIDATTMESWRFLRKFGMEPSFDSVLPLLGLYTKDLKSAYNSDTATSIFIATQFTIAKLWNQTRCPSTDEWIKKLWYIYTMDYYSVIKKLIYDVLENGYIWRLSC